MDGSSNARRVLWIALPALLIVAVGVMALPRALAWHRHHHHVTSSMELAEHLEDGLDYLLDKVDATDAQHSQAMAIAARRAPELYGVLSEGRAVRKELASALLAEQLDPARVSAAQARLDVLAKRASELGLAGLSEVAQLLTPAQRKELAKRLARFEH